MSGTRKHFVTTVDELDESEHVIVDIEEREIAVFNLEGEYYGLLNYCVHQSGPACEGRLTGEVVEDEDGELSYERDGEFVCCPWHGWEFDIKSATTSLDPTSIEYQPTKSSRRAATST